MGIRLAFEKRRCVGTWAGKKDFFCHCEAESPAYKISTLTKKSVEEFIFAAVYPMLVPINQTNLVVRSHFRTWLTGIAEEGYAHAWNTDGISNSFRSASLSRRCKILESCFLFRISRPTNSARLHRSWVCCAS